MKSALALWLACVVVAATAVPTAWVLIREALHRVWTRTALRELDEARRLVGASSDEDAKALATTLTSRFNALTVERAVLELLRSDDSRTRAWGSKVFVQLGLVERYSALLRSAPKWSERTHAAEVLGLAAASQAVPALVEALRDRHEDAGSVKIAAAAALAKLRDPSAIPLLVNELANVDERSSRNVAEAFVAFGSLAVPALLELLADASHATSRVWAARILGRIGDPRAVDDLISRLNDRDDRLRMTAAEALGALGDARALQPIVRATLRDPAPQVRAHAAGAVARIEGERAVDVLVAALADPDYATRLRALEAFETMRIEDTSPLEAALRDPNAEVRRRAALALERVGYLERVIRLLEDPDRAVRSRAYAALMEIGQVGLVDSIASYVHHASFQVRATAARACGELGVVRVAPVLLRAVNDEAWPVRAAVCEALGRLRHDDAPAALVRALGDTEEAVREAAAEALASYPSAQLVAHVDALANAYEGGTVAVRRHVVMIAGRIDGGTADLLLVKASMDPSDAVRLPAVTGLGQRGGDATVEPLVARLTDASLDVRMAAVTALGAHAHIEAFEGLLRALPGAPVAVRDRIAEALARSARELLFTRLPELEANASLDVRLGIAWTLGKIGDPDGAPTLARFLHNEEAAVRASAAGALAKIPGPASRDALLVAVEDPDGRVRAAVVNALGRVGGPDERVLAALEARSTDPDTFVRNRGLIALARAGGKATEARVRAHLSGVEPAAGIIALALVATETSVASVLEALATPAALDAVMRSFEREEPAVRAAFFAALHLEDPVPAGLSSADAPALVVQYEKTLRTSLDVDARRIAVTGLDRLGVDRAIPALADAAVGDPNESVRLRATLALAAHASDATGRRALVRAVADPNVDVAIAAIEAVAARREPEVSQALYRRLGAGVEKVQDVVEEALAARHREDPEPFLDWMMGVDVPDLLAPGVRVLSRVTSPRTLPLLQHLLHSSSPLVRTEVVRAIGKIPGPEAVAAMDEMAQDPSEDVRLALVDAVQWSAEALTRMAQLRRDPSVAVRVRVASSLERPSGVNAKSAHKALEGMLGDASARVRAAVLASLAGSPDPDGLRAFGRLWHKTSLDTRMEFRAEPRASAISDRVAACLGSSSDPVERRAAVAALGAFGAPGYSKHLVPALRDPSPDVRIAAIQALSSVDDADVRARIAELVADPDSTVQAAARRSLIHTVG